MSIEIENGKERYCGTGVDINPLNNCPELYIYGEFVCGWKEGIKPENIFTQALIEATKWGKTLKIKEIQKVLGQ